MPPVCAVPRFSGTTPLKLDLTVYSLRVISVTTVFENINSALPFMGWKLCWIHVCSPWIVDNDKSGTVTAALTIALSSRSTVGPKWTAAVLTLISAVVYPLLKASSNRRIPSAQMRNDSSIRPISLFQSDRTTSFKLRHLFVMCKKPPVRHCYSRRKIFTIEMQQKFWPSDWELLFKSACWMRSSDAL